MKVIFLKDVKGQGLKDQVKEVSDGYATNYLIPNRLAKIATQGNLSSLSVKKQIQMEESQLAKSHTLQLKQKLEEVVLSFKLQIVQDKAFGSISNKDIVEQLSHKYKIELDKRKFVHFKNLNTLGKHYLNIKLPFGIDARLLVEIKGA